MGNRFRELPGYHNLILAHGIIAAITFLFIVPASIFLSRFYTRPRTGIRLHIWLQILTVLLVIVIFTLGNVAVGPSRKLSNPHHGTGTAIFVLVLFEFIQGWWIHRKDWRRKQSYEPLSITVSQLWMRHITGLTELHLVTQLAWVGDSAASACTDTPWTHALRFTKSSVHPLRLSRFYSPCNSFRSHTS